MRQVYFSFHYEADVSRANLVRHMWVADKQATRFTDAADFEKVRYKTDRVIANWIDRQMHGTSVTVVLIGTKTLNRPWVKYEIEQSIARGNGVLGIHINRLAPLKIKAILEPLGVNLDGYNSIYSPKKYETKSYSQSPATNSREYYNWIRSNIGKWVERAAIKAGR